MQSIDFLLTFRGIDVPTTKMMGKDACGLTFRPIVDGREQDSDHLIFAYQKGIVWETTLVDVEPGQYRVTLISNDLHCSQDVTIDDKAISDNVLRVEFIRADCRRKLFPFALKRLWGRVGEYLEKRREHPTRDNRVLTSYRRRFRRGPVGSWISSHDALTIYGCSIEFCRDFTGTVCTWGYEDDESETERHFRWQCAGDCAIDVQPEDDDVHPEDWGRIDYDFRVTRSPHGRREVLMYSKNEPQPHPEEPGFWWSTHGVTLVKRDR